MKYGLRVIRYAVRKSSAWQRDLKGLLNPEIIGTALHFDSRNRAER